MASAPSFGLALGEEGVEPTAGAAELAGKDMGVAAQR